MNLWCFVNTVTIFVVYWSVSRERKQSVASVVRSHPIIALNRQIIWIILADQTISTEEHDLQLKWSSKQLGIISEGTIDRFRSLLSVDFSFVILVLIVFVFTKFYYTLCWTRWLLEASRIINIYASARPEIHPWVAMDCKPPLPKP